MTSYYTNTLYPLQNKVLATIEALNLSFYLTGGTALSRGYYHHRFSDDLDLFVNQDPGFTLQANHLIQALAPFNPRVTSQSTHYYSLLIADKLKIDLVNDTGKRLNKPISTQFFNQVDSWQNILANKLTALLGRDDPKDVVDIWIISQNNTLDWPNFFEAANSKAVGVFPPTIAEKLTTFPPELLKLIKWSPGIKPTKANFKKDLESIVQDILAIK